MSGDIINADRSLAQVTQGIRVLTAQTVANMCQIGKLLTEAKAMVGHGGWGEYLEKEVAYSQSTANNFMRLFEEYGEFGPNSQTIANLGPTKAGLLLALPAEQREQFAEEHKDDSVRKLKAEIARLTKRAEAAEASDQAARTMLATATEENGVMQQRLSSIDADYRGQLDTVSKENDALRAEVAQVKAAADVPAKISAEEAEKLRAEGRREVEKQMAEDLRLAAAEAGQEIDELKRQLAEAQQPSAPSAMGDPDMAAFGVLLAQLGETVNKMLGHYKKRSAHSPEDGQRMAKALKAFHGRLGTALAGMPE